MSPASSDNPASRYEIVIARLLKTKLREDFGESPQVTHRRHFRGSSGQSHEIDLSFELTTAETRLLVLVECKCYNRDVGVDDVAEFAYKIRDIGAHKGILVTTKGFQAGAKKIAAKEGIALVTAVRAWVVVAYRLAHTPPRYIIGPVELSRHDFLSSRTDMPAVTMQTAPVDEKTRPSEVYFYPAIDHLIGDPFTLFSAAQIFLKHEAGQVDPVLADLHDMITEMRELQNLSYERMLDR